jgi:hypothetical protein
MKSLMHIMVVEDALNKHDQEQLKVASSASVEGRSEHVCCDLCGENPCVWVAERAALIANNDNEHGHMFYLVNKTRRKIAFRHMFWVVNGGPGQKGVRKRLPECVESGVGALFPDNNFMGFKEE